MCLLPNFILGKKIGTFRVDLRISNLRCCRGWRTRRYVYLGGSSKCCWELYYWCKREFDTFRHHFLKPFICLDGFRHAFSQLPQMLSIFLSIKILLWLGIQDLRAMTDAAEHRPVILINARLKVHFLVPIL